MSQSMNKKIWPLCAFLVLILSSSPSLAKNTFKGKIFLRSRVGIYFPAFYTDLFSSDEFKVSYAKFAFKHEAIAEVSKICQRFV